ncbi:MAG: hypothetical protein E7510_09405 [Ruminococcus sp.]|nr:hypothetical protein [Ruminococcus sp.]
MNVNKQQYDDNKSKVISLINDTIDYLRDINVENTEVEAFEKLRSNVENSLFSIVLVGEFSAGKSTFLNALMGKYVLPSFTSETTATVNFLRHTEKAPKGEAGIVYYRDGRTVSLPDLQLQTIEKFVSTRGDSDDEKIATSVDHVDLFLDSEFLSEGVQLVDSPGLNGVADNHRAITEQQIEASHAAIFMFSADHPGSKTDFEYLRELMKKSKNIFFVLNKINVIRESEGETVEQVIETLQSTYKKQFPEETTLPKIWPVAGNAALVARDSTYNEYQNGERVTTEQRRQELLKISRIENFEDRLRKYLYRGERAKAQLLSPIEKLIALLSEKRTQSEQELSILQAQTGTEELIHQKEALETVISQLDSEKKSETKELRACINQVLTELKEQIDANNARLMDKCSRKLESCEDCDELFATIKELKNVIENTQIHSAKLLESALREKLIAVIENECDDYADKLNFAFSDASDLEQFSKVTIEFHIDDLSVDVGYRAYEEKVDKLRKDIENLEMEFDKLSQDAYKSAMIERNRQQLQAQLDALESRRDMIMDTFVIPDTTRYSEECDASYWRGGLFGWIGNALFGKKKATTTKIREDDSARKDALSERSARVDDIDKKMQSIETELDKSEKASQSSEYLFKLAERSEKRIDELMQQLSEEQKKFETDAQKKRQRKLKQTRNDIFEQLDELVMEIGDNMKKYLEKQKCQYTKICFDMINAHINAKLQNEKSKLEKLIEMLNAEGSVREEKILQNKQAISKSIELMNRCIALQTLLSETMNDYIEQEEI